MSEEQKRKAPTRKERRAAGWKMEDSTTGQRARQRRQQLDEIAQGIGYESWRKLETAALRGEVIVFQSNPTAIIV